MKTRTLMPSAGQSRRTAFTLIELLVVIAIISILAAILFPVFAGVREKARQTTCLSNMRQIGIGVRAYLQDYDETMPIFTMYDIYPKYQALYGGYQTPFTPHRGVEVEITAYTGNNDIFRCPDDTGDPQTGGASYRDVFGSSYRFGRSVYSVVSGYSSENDGVITTGDKLVTDSQFISPAETRIMRDEMFPWFGPETDPTGNLYFYYSADPASTYYQRWHSTGGSMVFADGHAKYVSSRAYFNQILETPDGQSYNTGCWRGCE